MKKSALFATCSLFTLANFANPASAQSTGAAAGVEEVTVSASRITIAGYQQPTPVTVIGVEKLQRDGLADLGDAIRQLPALGTSSSPNTSNGSQQASNGGAGLNLVNLRNLGVSRTLVLFDGKRVVSSDASGGVDLNLLPTSLVQRIDIVTGGASAAWGSDAVSGVVNVILNKNFTGWQGNLEGQMNKYGTRKTAKAELSYGTDLFDGNAHLILSGSYLNSPDTVVPQQMPYYNAAALVNNPAYAVGNGQPRLIHARHVGLSTGTQGGLITSGPLKGIQFLQGGTPAQFNFGNVSGSLSNGGSAPDPALIGETDDISVPILNYTFFGHLSYQISSQVRATLDLNYGHTNTDNGSAPYSRFGNITITADNPYIPAAVLAQMTALKITSFPIGTTNGNNCNGAVDDFNTDDHCIGNLSDHVKRDLQRVAFSLDGAFGDWTWDANVQHSQIRRQTHLAVDPVIANYNLAVDAVVAPAGNTAGIAPGTIVCRSTLTNPTNGCQPLNVLGIGVASDAAIKYIAQGGPALTHLILSQDTASISVQGQPFSDWAGPISVAIGGDYRKEAVVQTADALSYARAYGAGNFQALQAHYETQEGFAEAEIPLLKDSFVETADFNAAGRITNYSTSGVVETWKIGLTSQVTDDVRVRTTWSADIRAPTLTDLFNPGTTSLQAFSDPFRNGQIINVYALSGGNPNLNPEKATTISGGFVLTPHWVPGLNMSVDWYSIDIKGAIYSTPYAQELTQCYAGQTVYCSALTRDANGVLTQISGSPLNAASQTASGLDFQADYATEIFNGTLEVNLLGTYQDEFTLTALGTAIDNAGSVGIDPPNVSQLGGQPKFRASLSATYQESRYSATLQLRGIGAATLNNTWVQGVDIDNNIVDPVGYIDLRGSYYLDDSHTMQLYAGVDNVLNTPPPEIPGSQAANLPFFFIPTRTDIYDALGRMMRAGIRARF